MVESKAQCNLTRVETLSCKDRTNRLTCALTLETITIVSYTEIACPSGNDITLSACRLAAPVHEIVLRRRHGTIRDNLLNLSHINRIWRNTLSQCLNNRLNIKGAIAILNILHNHALSNRERSVEGQLRICAMAACTATILQNSCNTCLRGKLRSWRRNHDTIDNEEHHYECQQRYQKELTLFKVFHRLCF